MPRFMIAPALALATLAAAALPVAGGALMGLWTLVGAIPGAAYFKGWRPALRASREIASDAARLGGSLIRR